MSSESHLQTLKDNYGTKLILLEKSDNNRLKVQVNQDNLLEVMQFLKYEMGFSSLESVTGLDWESYFEVVYHIDRWDGDPTLLQVHIRLDNRENPVVPSLTSIWASANWHERELWDLYGINVKDHPNLKRLLLPDEWDDFEHKHISELYPMRKEYKLPEKPYSFKPHPK
ncbi:NADH-quinone oxidoreductase subunit C [Candidatus Hodarchaeum mangrovi]